MSDFNKDNAQPSMEERLTAFLMGEADAATSAEVQAALEVDPDLRARRDSIEHTLDLIKQADPLPGVGNLDESRRVALREAAAAELKPRAWRPTPLLSAAALLLLVGGVAYVNQDRWLTPPSVNHASLDSSSSDLSELAYGGGSFGYGDDSLSTEEMSQLSQLGYESGSADSSPRLGRIESERPDSSEALRGLNQPLAKGSITPAEKRFSKGPSTPSTPGVPSSPPAATKPADGTYGFALDPNAAPAGDATVGFISADRAGTENTGVVGGLSFQPTTETSTLGGGGGGGGWTTDKDGKLVRHELAAGESVILGDQPNALLLEPITELGYVDETYSELGLELIDADGYYLDSDVEADGEDDIRRLRDSTKRYRGRPAQPRCVVYDGYGRRYVDAHVVTHLRPEHRDESPRDMFFRYYGDNPEVIAKIDPLSTFAADVDTASYPMARNYLVNGQLPPKQAIRTEEFVNYFDYKLEAPTEGDFAVHMSASPSAFGGKSERTLLSIGIKAREVLDEERKPMNLVFVIDKSGSMEGERMQLVKDSLELLVDQMREDDTLGIVTFDSNGHEALQPTSARERWKLREVIRGLSTGGSTNAAEGLEMGYKMMETCFSKDRINRLVLASDGVANTGETDQERILQTVRAKAEADVDLTTLGVGMGNHNDVFLEQLANKGDGSCHYIDDFAEAKRVLVEQFLGTMITIARDVKIQVEFDSKIVMRWRQLGYENRSLAHQDFRNDAIDAGEVGSGHEVTALYELDKLVDANPEAKLVTVRLRWFPDGSSEATEQEFTLDVAAAQGRWGLAPSRLRLAGVVAQYAEVLRRSYHAREDSYLTLRQEADKLVREMQGDADVVELRDMIERTAELARYSPPTDDLAVLMETMRGQQLRAAQLRLLGGEDNKTQDLLAAIELQNQEIEERMLELLKD
jgi:Ca-activated chloride channel family protein